LKILGLTGSFGTGKTYAASVFRSLGAVVIDADKISHYVIGKNRHAWKKIVRVFGRKILAQDGSIDRKALAGIVFSDKRKLYKLNSIVHPEVISLIRAKLEKYISGNKVIVIDAPLLVEARITGMVDRLVVVTCEKEIQIGRCRKKFRIEKEEILKRIESQVPIKKKIRLANWILDNSGTKAETKRQIKKVWREIAWK